MEQWINVSWVQWGPLQQGEPHHRPRVFSFGCCRDRLKWIGPETHEEVQRDFEELFGARVVADGSMYMGANPDYLKKVTSSSLAARHIHIDNIDDVPIAGDEVFDTLCPGNRQRYVAYDEIQMATSKYGDAFLADLDHWPNTRSTHGNEFPCQLKHGCVWSWQLQRAAVGLEHLAAQGLHVLDGMHSRYHSRMQPYFESLGESAIKELSGNGMCISALAAWVVYCFSNVVRVEGPKFLEEHALATAAASTTRVDGSQPAAASPDCPDQFAVAGDAGDDQDDKKPGA